MWAGQNRDETPLPTKLIQSAMRLWRYALRGQDIPRDKLYELRQQARPEDRQVSKQLQAELRYLIGEMTLDGSLDVNGKTIGPFIMRVLCQPYDKNEHTLMGVLELTKLLSFTLGGYNLKELTALASHADVWLETVRANTSEEREKKRRVRELLDDLLEFLATTRFENYQTIQEERHKRQMAKALEGLDAELLRRPSKEELTSELAVLDNRISESWRHLQRIASRQHVAEMQSEVKKAEKQIPVYERALDQLKDRLTKRREGLAILEHERGGHLSEEERRQFFISAEEKRWREETERELGKLRKIDNRTWQIFTSKVMPEIDLMLSAERQIRWLRAEIEVRHD